MEYYNTYYKDRKLNNRPLTAEEISNIKNLKEIYKRNKISNKLEEINTSEITYIKTILI